jgi:hypothetical protein
MKLLITEEQYKLFERDYGDIMSIRDLAKIIADRGYGDEAIDIFHKILIRLYKHSGDEGVIKYFTDATGVGIEQISRGRYIFWR